MSTASPALALLLLAGCGQMAVDGEVVTASGEPATGARVTAIGTTCTTTVGEDGRFALPCQPGSYSLLITREGYIEIDKEVDAPERERYDLGKMVMVAIPDSPGLFRFVDDHYQELAPGLLDRTIKVAGGNKTRAYCLDRDASEANELPVGTHAFFDNETKGWRPFRLDEQGCAYRDAQDSKARWEVVYKDKPAYEERTLEQGRKLVAIELPAGEYFIADWDQGFFTPTQVDGEKRYTGSWLVVR